MIRTPVALIVLVLALLWVVGAHSAPPQPCIAEESREKVRKIMLDAIDEALRNHTVHMFEVWMKDEYNQPNRAVTGMRQGIIAYTGSHREVMRWNPPACK